MKRLKAIICLFCYLNFLINSELIYAQRKTYDKNTDFLNQQENYLKANSKKMGYKLLKLKKIKLHILNGEFDQAKVLLKKASLENNFTKTIQLRYLAIINFIEGNYSEVLNILSEAEMRSFTPAAKTCSMRIITLVITDNIEELKINWPKCKDILVSKSSSNLLWLETIVDIKINKGTKQLDKNFDGIAIDNYFGDELKLYLKLALYLDKQKEIIPRFKYFGLSQIQDKRTQELIGLNHFRNGDLVKANQFLSDLETVNAEIFKGNIYLYQKKYELAYARFILALSKKNNSQNSLERIVPLSWKLSQWKKGYIYTNQLDYNSNNKDKNLSLQAAFLTMNEDHKSVKKILKKISKNRDKNNPIEISQLSSLNSLKTNDYISAELHSAQSCYLRDGLNCWLNLQLHIWDNFNDLINRKKQIHGEEDNLLALLTETKINSPIKENKYIEQKYIEELDDEAIQLIAK